ncbi:cyclic-di-AMP-binding protein CbpB [Globicatella sanguinis]|uniref:cyclic-di-AMP-binding protein CbpB n=1 Tax=Globicatella sanguinis TaxID=13076 RepID=UPI0008248F21|nr:cyclic-di-AMP-binding protein CbpB [Globicatella sanguinis]
MINPLLEKQIVDPIEKLLIPADNVAHVLDTNTLSHGMLILSTVKYSMIPVLSTKSKLMGLINMPMMINAVTTVEAIEIEKMDQILIRDVMEKDPVTIVEGEPFEKILHHLVDQNFICMIDHEGNFKGIITRRELLKRINHFLHEISIPEKSKELLVKLTLSENLIS